MCTYLTEQIKVAGSGKGADGWFGLTDASVYFDHPVHASAEHSLNIDFLNPGQGPSARAVPVRPRPPLPAARAGRSGRAPRIARILGRQQPGAPLWRRIYFLSV